MLINYKDKLNQINSSTIETLSFPRTSGLSNKHYNELNFTFIVTISSWVYISGNLIDTISSIMNSYFYIFTKTYISAVLCVTNCIFYLSHCVNFFIFFKFNMQYNQNLVQLYSRLKQKL